MGSCRAIMAARGYAGGELGGGGAAQLVTSGCILKIVVRTQFSTQTDTLEERRE